MWYSADTYNIFIMAENFVGKPYPTMLNTAGENPTHVFQCPSVVSHLSRAFSTSWYHSLCSF